MKQIEIEINNKKYKCKVAESDEDRIKGLQNVKELPKNEILIPLSSLS